MGLRNVNSYMVELSAHIVEDYVNTSTTSAVSAPGISPVGVPTTDAMYPGAQIIVNDPNPALVEIVTIIDVVLNTSFSADFAFAHAAGVQLLGATFPTQQPTDPLFTQSEILSYFARAQNEFLSKLPLVFAFTTQNISIGQLFQPTPPTAIELERVALGNVSPTSVLTISSLALAGGIVTAIVMGAASPYPVVNQPVYVFGTSNDAVFGGVQTLTSVVPGVPGILTWNSTTSGTASATGGNAILLTWTRLYETTQEQIANRNPSWLYAGATAINPQAWFEDRTGVYGWGIAPPPGSGFPVELLYSQRGPETLTLTSNLLIPDILGYIVKYKVLQWVGEKAGEQRSPQLADYCKQRFDRGIAIVDRYLRNMQQVGG